MDQSQNAVAEKSVEDKDPLHIGRDRTRLAYTSCYCEENVWKLCEEIARRLRVVDEEVEGKLPGSEAERLFSRCFAVFVSNPTKSVPIWCQRASADPRAVPVVWDYHVILVVRGSSSSSPSSSSPSSSPSSSSVYDLDTILPFPETFSAYFDQSFGDEDRLKARFRRFFRVIPAREFLNRFASDRRHMKKPDGSWAMPPPGYPPIRAKDGTRNNIDRCIDVRDSTSLGRVMDAKTFYEYFIQLTTTDLGYGVS